MSEQDTITSRAAGLHVLGFAGSLRAASYNRALLRTAVEMAPDGLRIDVFDLIALPLYNGDVEAGGDPDPVATFKTAMRKADAILIACPEYNHGVPGVLKNAIDWASRPPRGSPLGEKLAGIIGASPGMTGSARGQTQLRQAFNFTNTYAMLQPELLVARAHEKFDADGRLNDDVTRSYLGRYLETFRQWVDQRGRGGH
jgi:chromate reductase, NAD(P)H dehydrogenase (quinone)